MVSKCRLSHLMPLIQLFLPSNSHPFSNHTKWFLPNGCYGWFLVDFYGSKEIAIFVDDDYVRNGTPALDDELEKRTLKIAQKLPLPIQFDVGNITDMLNKSLNLNWSVLVSMELVFDGTFSSPLSSGSLKLVLNSPLFFTFYFDRCIAYAFHKMKMTTFTHLYDHKYQRHESNTILWHPTQVTILLCNAKETQLSRQQIENGEKKVSYLKIVINFFNCEYIQLI